MDFRVDETLLLSCLKTAHPNAARITVTEHRDGEYVVEPGTNYSSEIVRLRVRYECDGEPFTRHFVLKVPFLSVHYDFLNGLGFYDKETYMYEAVVPRMAALLDGAVVPRHYGTAASHVIVLEDLARQNFYVKTRAALDYAHCARTFEALAMFHAASAKLHRQQPDLLVPASREALYTKTLVAKMMKTCCPALAAVLRSENVPSRLVRRFVAYEERINSGDVCAVTDRVRCFDVLNHGDLKTNNIMFKGGGHDGQQPVAVKLLDYQTCRWNSPVLDLIFFNMATMDYAVYEKGYDELLHLYLTTLNATMRQLDCDCVYTRDEYEADVHGCKLFLVFTLLWIGFLDLREAIPGFDYHKRIRLEGDEIEAVRKNDSFKNRFLKWFWNFEKRGYFD